MSNYFTVPSFLKVATAIPRRKTCATWLSCTKAHELHGTQSLRDAKVAYRMSRLLPAATIQLVSSRCL